MPYSIKVTGRDGKVYVIELLLSVSQLICWSKKKMIGQVKKKKKNNNFGFWNGTIAVDVGVSQLDVWIDERRQQTNRIADGMP